MNEHPFEIISLVGELNSVEIDIKLVRTITLLNNHMGWFTRFCCQGSGGTYHLGYILFENKSHFKKFLEYVPALRNWKICRKDHVVRFPTEDIPYIETSLMQQR